MNKRFSCMLWTWFCSLFLCHNMVEAQTTLPYNQTVSVNTLTSDDYIIPEGISSLTIEVRGADGGNARLVGTFCDTRVRGGAGATMKATFPVGNSGAKLRPGGVLRIFAGRAGQNDDSGCSPVPALRYGAGGGSSAILYKKSGDIWDVLAIAGGGGGGARPFVGVFREGFGGNNLTSGTENGDTEGGTNGSCGTYAGDGYGGAGFLNCAFEAEQGRSMVTGYNSNNGALAVGLKDKSFAAETGGKKGIQPIGGDGFTGGAVGAAGGGGGGGYSGGAGQEEYPGGGGGSFVTAQFSPTGVSRQAGGIGGATNHPTHGFVKITIPESICPIGDVVLNSQQAVNDFAINYPNCTEIAGDLAISGTDIVDLSPLANITSVQGNLSINNTFITNLAAFSSLRNVGGGFAIVFNDLLENFDGLNNLITVGNDFRVVSNEILSSVSDIDQLNFVGGNVEVFDNSDLTDFVGWCPFLDNGTLVGEFLAVNNGVAFEPADCLCVVNPPPSIASCNANVTIELDANGQGELRLSDVDNGSVFSPCVEGGRMILGAGQYPLPEPLAVDCNTSETLTLNLVLFDGQDNVLDFCSSTVSIVDVTLPTALCQDVEVSLDANGQGRLTPADIDNGSFDNCGSVSFSLSTESDLQELEYSCADSNTFAQLEVTDPSGNSSTCFSEVTIVDRIAPIVNCKDVTVELGADGRASYLSNIIEDEVIENCELGVNFIQEVQAICQDIGTISVSYTVKDAAGNEGSCTANVTIVDNTAPTASCQDVEVILDANGQGSLAATDLDNGSFDNCGPVSFSFSNGIQQVDFDCDDVNTSTLLILEVSDNSGLTSTCVSEVTFNDPIAPVVSCKDITVELGANGTASYSAGMLNAGIDDNCGGGIAASPTITVTCADVGTIPVTFTAKDAAGNEGSCTGNVTIVEYTAPTALCKDIEVILDANGQGRVTPADINDGSFDNCGPVSFSLSTESDLQQVNFSCADLGTFAFVLLEVTDPSGNSSTCFSEVTLADQIAPTALCKDFEVILDANGLGRVTPVDINDGSFDNCGPVSFSLSTESDLQQVDFSCADLGTFAFVLLEVTDQNGNSSTCFSEVTLVDQMAPTAQCKDFEVILDANGLGRVTPVDINDGSFDNCGPVSFSLSTESDLQQVDFSCADLGTFAFVLLEVTDQSGNSSTCFSEVTVADNTAPTLSCKSFVWLTLDETGNATLDPQSLFSSSGDNCGITLYNLSQSEFSCEDLGIVEVSLTAQDQAGNISNTCSAEIAVFPNTPAFEFLQIELVALDENGQAILNIDDVAQLTAGVCNDVLKLTFKDGGIAQTFTCQDIGEQYLEVVVTRQNGEEYAQGLITITVVDNIPPTALCKDFEVSLDADGQGSIVPSDIDNGSFDNCGSLGYSFTNDIQQLDFSCSDANTSSFVILEVSDNGGLSSTCISEVVIKDNIVPVVNCKDITVELSENGTAFYSANMLDAGVVDNCEFGTNTYPTIPVTCADIGTIAVTYAVKDVAGNEGSCTGNVTIVDPIAPSIGEIQLPLDPIALGNAVSVSTSFTENCSMASMVWDWGDASQSDGIVVSDQVTGDHTYTEAGVYVITLTLIDQSGNTVSKQALGYVVIFDTSGAYVTGNGFITSPAGALLSDPSATGKAHFGFVSRYKKGTNVPTGKTDYRFKAGDFKFRSTEYEWLVVAGEKAKFKGWGEIEGVEGYRFMVTGIDGDLLGNASPDKFRIKIWEESGDGTENIIYDNQLGASETDDDTQEIEGGSIKIKKANGNGNSFQQPSIGNHFEQTVSSDLTKTQLDLKAFPNPFSRQLTLEFFTSEAVQARIDVFNLNGQVVRTLFNGQLDAGQHQMEQWEGTDASGNPLPAGMYLIQMRTGEEVVNQKVLLQR